MLVHCERLTFPHFIFWVVQDFLRKAPLLPRGTQNLKIHSDGDQRI